MTVGLSNGSKKIIKDRKTLDILKPSCQKFVLKFLNSLFYKYGCLVATHPIKFILLSLMVVGLSSIGFLRFNKESSIIKLWISEKSDQR